MAKDKSKEKKSKKKLLLITIFTLFCVVTMQLTFLFAVLGMLPSFVAHFVQRSPRQGIFHSVFACNLSGTAAVVVPLLARGNDVADLHTFMSDATNWFIMYASAGFGWVLVYGCPYVGQFMIDAIHSKTLSRLGSNNKKLEEEWGDNLRFNDALARARKKSAKAS